MKQVNRCLPKYSITSERTTDYYLGQFLGRTTIRNPTGTKNSQQFRGYYFGIFYAKYM